MKKKDTSPKVIKEKALRRAFALGCVKFATSEEAFFQQDFGPTANFIACKRKPLHGDFNRLAKYLYKKYARDDHHMEFFGALRPENIRSEIPRLKGKIKRAAKEVYRDMRLLEQNGAIGVSLRIINDKGYKTEPEAIFKDKTHHFHVDGGDREKGRFLCRYTGAETENLVPQDAVPSMTLQEYRDIASQKYAQDKARDVDHGIVKYFTTCEAYIKHLEENDNNHYSPKKGAVPFSFGIGDLVRQATIGNSARVPPGIHRAKKMKKGDPLKMLLVGDFLTL